MAETLKPVPRPSPESVPYWRAAREHRLEIPQCDDCSQYWFPPSSSCPHCLSANVGFKRASGRGKVFSFVMYDRVYHPSFVEEVPYVVALVELEEGPRMISNIVGVPPEDIVCDMPVEIVFDDVVEGVTLPKFKPSAF